MILTVLRPAEKDDLCRLLFYNDNCCIVLRESIVLLFLLYQLMKSFFRSDVKTSLYFSSWGFLTLVFSLVSASIIQKCNDCCNQKWYVCLYFITLVKISFYMQFSTCKLKLIHFNEWKRNEWAYKWIIVMLYINITKNFLSFLINLKIDIYTLYLLSLYSLSMLMRKQVQKVLESGHVEELTQAEETSGQLIILCCASPFRSERVLREYEHMKRKSAQ